MVSFIVIGKNEERNIARCLRNISDTVNYCHISGLNFSHEIVYVDGGSSDKSVEIALTFEGVRVVEIEGPTNAANGRNIGARNARGDIFFFIDGDMTIYQEFALKYLDLFMKGQEYFVFGEWMDVIDGQERVRNMTRLYPGGAMMITRVTWESVGGMNSKFKTGEEAELALRLRSRGHAFEKRNELMVKHHTVSYFHPSRLWSMLWNKSIFYNRAVTYRTHFLKEGMLDLLVKNDKTFLLLLLSFAVMIVSPMTAVMLLHVYLILVLVRSFKNRNTIGMWQMVPYYLISDVLNLVYFFTFHPKRIQEIYHEKFRQETH